MSSALALLALVSAANFSADLSPEAFARCAELAPELEIAAEEAGLPAEVLQAQCLHETGGLAIEGRRADVTGVLQVSWSTWGALLAAEGFTAGDLLDPEQSVLAAGPVLRSIATRWPGLTVAQRLCAYGVGADAVRLGWQTCRYSDRVLGLARGLRGQRKLQDAPRGEGGVLVAQAGLR